MRVEIDPALMAQPEAVWRHLDAIVETFDTGQHEWVIEDPDAILESRWVTEAARYNSLLGEMVRKTYRAALDQSAPPTLRVSTNKAATDAAAVALGPLARWVPPASARQILTKCAYLVVEDKDSDGLFVRAMAKAFGNQRVLDAIRNQWLEFEHAGGGGNFLKRIDDLLESGIITWRIMVIADSDRMNARALPEKTEKLRDKMKEYDVKTIVLFKREIENYLPDSAIDDRAHHNKWISLKGLTREQRDYYDMKEGFKQDKEGKPIIHDDHGALFEGVNHWHLKRLIGGFGKRIGERFSRPITREEMQHVCSTYPGEIELILAAIEEIL